MSKKRAHGSRLTDIHIRREVEKGRRLAKKVYEQKGMNCWWCGIVIVPISFIPQHSRIFSDNIRVVWRMGNKVHEGRSATIDHVKPLSMGGLSHIDNLVPACYDCNQKRGMETNR